MRETLSKTFNLIERGQWRRWLLLVLLALTLSGFEMLGAVLVFLLIRLASEPTAPIELPIVGDVRNRFEGVDDQTLLIGLAVGLAVFFLTRAVLRIGTVYIQARVAQNAGARLSNRLVAGYLGAPYSFHLRRNSADLIRNSHQAVSELVNQVFLPIIRIGAESIVVLGLLGVMVATAPLASAIAVVVIGSSAGILLIVVQPRLKKLGRVAHSTNRDTLSLLQQSLHGIRDVKLLGRERWFARRYAISRVETARALYLRNALSELPRSLIELSLIGFILIFFGVTIVAGEGSSSTLSVLGLFAYVGLRLQPSVQIIVAGINSLKFSSAPLDDLNSDLAEIIPTPTQHSDRVLPFSDSIKLEDVTFSYEGAPQATLARVNLVINQGDHIGICGPTGGGKTTLIDLITGMIEPSNGRITVDGIDLSQNTRAWQRSLGVVPQTVFLLDDSLRRNIALGVPDEDVDEEALNDAVDLAQIGAFVESLPRGLETSVGERGVRISGGQRQRIAIARALYRHPSVLIFDEGTSALDNATEAALMEAIDRLRGDRTILVVAHRLSTVETCDRILFVESGVLAAQGTFQDLWRSNQSFQLMADAGLRRSE